MAYKHTVFFFSSTYKGIEMVQQVHDLDCYVLLMTEDALRDEPWPFDAIDEFFTTPDLSDYQAVIHTVAYLNRGRRIDYLVSLDEFEMELVATLREHLRLPGVGVSASRPYRDKWAMRETADKHGIRVPPFTGIKNYDDLRAYMSRTRPPWLLKPRGEASAMGIRRADDSEQVWRTLDELGDKQSYYLLEQFIPGDVYHADSIVYQGKIVFVSVQKYGQPPMQVYHGGGIFTTRVLPAKTAEAAGIRVLNERVIEALGSHNGVRHTEFIRAHSDGELYFLESAMRVGGANINDLIDYATGVNLWREWGRLVVMDLRGETYTLPDVQPRSAALLMTLARQEHPDLSGYNDPEVVWRADKAYHAGLILASDDEARTEALLEAYTQRFARDFLAVASPQGPQRT